jgi:acetyltransferase-like isoleucine patch superfamily enzyme
MAEASPMRPYLDPRDHAFANGPVFPRPSSLEAARALFDRQEDGDRLMELHEAFDRGAECGPGLRLGLNARLVAPPSGDKRVRIGADAAIRGIIRCEGQGRIVIGDRVHIGDGVIVSARAEIGIGAETLVAHGVQLFDNDTHPIDPEARAAHFASMLKLGPKGRTPDEFEVASRPVRIGRRCWLGLSSVVMKGVNIGDEAIVAAGAVVTADVPARRIVAGNPARVVRSLDGGRGILEWLRRS